MKTKLTRTASTETQKSARQTFKDLQGALGTDKENVGRLQFSNNLEKVKENANTCTKSMQTDKVEFTAEDLTSEDPGSYYWQVIAQTRDEENAELLNEYTEFNDEYIQLCRRNETLKQENQHLSKRVALDKEIIEDSAHLAEILNGILKENEQHKDDDEIGHEESSD